MKIESIVLVSVFAISLAACGDSRTASNKPGASPEVKKGIQPVSDSEIAVIEMENSAAYGTIKIELYSNIAPKMVERFKELARDGYYNGIAFHRINQSVIQAGDGNTKPDPSPQTSVGEGDSGKPDVPAEFSDLPYEPGTLGAARLGNNVNSANSQFFITLKREAAFDKNYTIFGKVIDGMNNVRTISGAPKDGERPVEPVRIKTIRIEAKP